MRHVLEREQKIERPRPEVFAFFAEAANLERLTPGSMHFRILTSLPIAMGPGTVIDYQIALYGVRFEWRTLIEEFEPESRFVDVQTKGPYRYWQHLHLFEEVPGGTVIRDRVEYEVPFGPLGEVARALFVGRQLRRIFDYRRGAVDRALGPRRPVDG